MIRLPTSSTRTDTLLPYTTLCRSQQVDGVLLARQDLQRGLAGVGLQHVVALVAEGAGREGAHRVLVLHQQQGAGAGQVAADRKSTRLNPVTNAHLVCRLLLEKKKDNNHRTPQELNLNIVNYI